MKTVKYCKDCKWFSWLGKGEFMSYTAWCESPNRPLDLVHGELETLPCSISRDKDTFCGKKAEWFEPK